MAVTLLQHALDNRVDRKQGALIRMLDQVSPVFRTLPMDRIKSGYDDYERILTLPSIAWRAVNQSYAESSGRTQTFREYLKILGGEVKWDVHLTRTSMDGGTRTRRTQTEMKLLAAANEWERSFFEGSELNDVDEMVGLRNRLAGNQLVLQASGGGTLTLAKLNDLIDAVPFTPSGPNGRYGEGAVKRGAGISKHLWMNRTVYSKLNSLIMATSGARYIVTERDDFGNYVERYRDAEIHVVEQTGFGGSAGTTLWFDEDPGDGTADTCSVYATAHGDGLLEGLYNNGNDANGADILMEVETFGGRLGMESEPRQMVRFEGSYGLRQPHPRAAARLYGITNT